MMLRFFHTLLIMIAVLVGIGFTNPVTTFADASSLEVASIFSFSGEQPKNLGVKEGKLAKCPQTPNCVSSQSKDVTHQIKPLKYESSQKVALNQLTEIIQNTENAKVIAASNDYIYAQYTSRIMGFVDDVEFYVDPENPIIHVRSASRLGESDLGVNRSRVESIREQFQG